MAVNIEQVECPNCGEVIDFSNQESTVFCPICEDTVFTQFHEPTLSQQIDDGYYGRCAIGY